MLATGHLFAAAVWGLEYALPGLMADVVIGAIAGLFILSARPGWPQRVALLALLVAPVLLHSWKLVTFGQPVAIGDGIAFIALVDVLSGLRKVAAIALSVALLWALWSARPPLGQGRAPVLAWVAGWLLVVATACGAGALLAGTRDEPADRRLLASGGWAFASVIVVEAADGGEGAPSAREVLQARSVLGLEHRPAGGSAPTRNVHIVLLESVWDPRRLTAFSFSRDPFDPRFRALLDAGRGRAIVPGFGGATANAEFEVLCGLPADGTSVIFERGLPAGLPCLPTLLRGAGYSTQAQHPFRESFWSRDRAYPAIGFSHYFHERAFDLADVDGGFLADHSLFEQVRTLGGDGPRRLVYTVTLSSHFPYDRDAARRPSLVEVSPASPMLEAYANAVAYTTAAFMDHLESVHAEDPDALVIAFGDHAPALGPAPNPYTASGLPFTDEAQRDRSFPVLAETPLVVVDGRRGIVETGSIPLYVVPYLALELLSGGGLELPLQAAFAPGLPAWSSRQFFGRHLLRREPGVPWQACAPEAVEDECVEARRVGEALLVLRGDLLEGSQYVNLAAGVGILPGEASADGLDRFASCDVSPIGVLPDVLLVASGGGGRALILQAQASRGEPALRVGGATFPMQGRSTERSAILPNEALRSMAGRQPVAWVCPGEGGMTGDLGWIDIIDAARAPAPATGACSVSVRAWGPASTDVGVSFNVAAPGRSALWLSGVELVGDVVFAVGGVPADVATSGSTMTLSFESDAVLAHAGELPVHWYCRDASGGTVGMLRVRAPGSP